MSILQHLTDVKLELLSRGFYQALVLGGGTQLSLIFTASDLLNSTVPPT